MQNQWENQRSNLLYILHEKQETFMNHINKRLNIS